MSDFDTISPALQVTLEPGQYRIYNVAVGAGELKRTLGVGF